MHKQHANIAFSDVSQADLSPIAHTIYSKMVTNAVIYSAPTTPMPAFIILINAWDAIIAKAEYAGRTGDLKNARIALEGALNLNGIYVNSIAKGDLAMLEKSGYPISKAHTPIGDLLPPDSVKVATGTAPTTFDIIVAVVENAKGYLFAYTPVTNVVNDPNQWNVKWSPKHNNTLGGFISGTQYKFAACAVGSTNNVFWTNAPSNLYAQ